MQCILYCILDGLYLICPSLVLFFIFTNGLSRENVILTCTTIIKSTKIIRKANSINDIFKMKVTSTICSINHSQ